MQSQQLSAILAPFSRITNRAAISPANRSLLLHPKLLRASSPFGVLEVHAAIGITEEVIVDASSFIAMVKTLPGEEEVAFMIKGGALHWDCGMASGKLALAAKELEIAIITPPENSQEAYSVPGKRKGDLAEALELGALSCGPHSLASAGVYGLLLDNRETFTFYSCDDVTTSACIFSARIPAFPDSVVISPEAVALWRAMLSYDQEEATVYMTDKSIHCISGCMRLFLRPVPPMKQDLAAILTNYPEGEVKAALPRERVAAFVRRAGALAESSQRTLVELAATEGALSLSFSEGTSSAEEYYLVEGLEVPEMQAIYLEGSRFARALVHVNCLELDHLARGVLRLSGNAPPFVYLISKRAQAPT